EKVNAKDVKGVCEVSKSTIEMVGPHGTAAGLETLSQWVEESGIQLTTLTRYAKESRIVYEQKGTWKDQAGEIIVYTYMEVKDGKVSRISRYETIEEAFGDSGLSEEDKVEG
ncbi:MAG TPA: nuclear transport factor 2 family protein, partial [Planococcus sp. (in: firmicutes)]|nr:nuclear transport factor 2 family protein [Planococcus sp. (in: firmicutes)]